MALELLGCNPAPIGDVQAKGFGLDKDAAQMLDEQHSSALCIGNALPAAGVWETRELFLRHECEAGDRHAEAFEGGASQAEVDLGAVPADAGDLVDRLGTFRDDVRAHL